MSDVQSTFSKSVTRGCLLFPLHIQSESQNTHTHYIQTTCVKVAVYNSFVYFFMISELYTVKRVELTVEFESSVGCLFSKSIKH